MDRNPADTVPNMKASLSLVVRSAVIGILCLLLGACSSTGESVSYSPLPVDSADISAAAGTESPTSTRYEPRGAELAGLSPGPTDQLDYTAESLPIDQAGPTTAPADPGVGVVGAPQTSVSTEFPDLPTTPAGAEVVASTTIPEPTEASASAPASFGQQDYDPTVSWVYLIELPLMVRYEPGTNSDVVSSLTPGDTPVPSTGNLVTLPTGQVWAEVVVGGVVGWVPTEFLTQVLDAPTTSGDTTPPAATADSAEAGTAIN